ncbi:MAG: TIGR00730 family Rossman fold protein [Bacteroidetes bacterium]|nr:MAG: TIGR00730 family Rossman fold protein [Bacteroidota bacterium]
MDLPHITVFCASSNLVDSRYSDVAERMGSSLANRKITLVYGGGDVGLMGVMARSVHANGGRVVGIIPHALRSIEGVAYEVADELIMTDTMRERKAKMYERADAFVALPGGIGTLEEFMEVITLKKLGYHDLPIALVNTDGFYDLLIEFFGELLDSRFLSKSEPALFELVNEPDAIFETESFRLAFSGAVSAG